MDEGRKRVLLIAAAILSGAEVGTIRQGAKGARHYERNCKCVTWAEEIMKAIDEQWPGRC